jgi:hypothetical protein
MTDGTGKLPFRHFADAEGLFALCATFEKRRKHIGHPISQGASELDSDGGEVDTDQSMGALVLDKVAGPFDDGLRTSPGIGRQKLDLPAKNTTFFVQLGSGKDGTVLARRPPDCIGSLKGDEQPNAKGFAFAWHGQVGIAGALQKQRLAQGNSNPA